MIWIGGLELDVDGKREDHSGGVGERPLEEKESGNSHAHVKTVVNATSHLKGTY